MKKKPKPTTRSIYNPARQVEHARGLLLLAYRAGAAGVPVDALVKAIGTDGEAEAMEDVEDILEARKAIAEHTEAIPWEQAKARLDAKFKG
jgi:hypothetical protein